MENHYFKGCISDSTEMKKEMKNCENKIPVPWFVRDAGYYYIDLCKKITECKYQIEVNVIENE